MEFLADLELALLTQDQLEDYLKVIDQDWTAGRIYSIQHKKAWTEAKAYCHHRFQVAGECEHCFKQILRD